MLVRARPLLGRRLIDLRISPQGTWAWGPAARADAFLIVDRDGRVAPLAITPTDFRGIAWSPNENLVAVASGDRIYVIETGSHYENLTQLEISARDLTWR